MLGRMPRVARSKSAVLVLGLIVASSGLAASAAFGASARSAVFHFAGQTSQCSPARGCGHVQIDVGKRLRQVKRFQIDYLLDCQSGRTLTANDAFTNIKAKVTRHGVKFAGASAPYQVSLSNSSGDFTGIAQASLHGILHGNGRGSGVFQVTVQVQQGGQAVDSCSTGSQVIGWTAHLV